MTSVGRKVLADDPRTALVQIRKGDPGVLFPAQDEERARVLLMTPRGALGSVLRDEHDGPKALVLSFRIRPKGCGKELRV